MKRVLVDAITFNELVKHVIENGAHLVDGVPWSFEYKGHHVTHENNECYLIDNCIGDLEMRPSKMLLSFPNDELMTFDKDSFDSMMEEI